MPCGLKRCRTLVSDTMTDVVSERSRILCMLIGCRRIEASLASDSGVALSC